MTNTKQKQLLTSRNAIFISQSLQKRIERVRILCAGCGLGSNIAVLAARTGFSAFTLVDGDIVDYSNLNRQEFYLDDIGKNKAVVLAKRLRGINRNIKVQILPKYIRKEQVRPLAKRANFVINTLDFSDAFMELNIQSMRLGKTAFLPFNVGYGSILLALKKKSTSVSRLLPWPKENSSNLDLYKKLLESLKIKLPDYLTRNLQEIFRLSDLQNYSPQLGIAANISAALVVTEIVRELSNQKIDLLPKYLNVDLWMLNQT